MRPVEPNGSTEIDQSLEKDIGRNIHELTRNSVAFRQAENGDGETLADTLVREAFETAREIENLIAELQELRKKLLSNSNRIQRDITEHTELNQQVMQLTDIISESVKKLPTAPSISP
jgi:seryl-tRNA synthetase